MAWVRQSSKGEVAIYDIVPTDPNAKLELLCSLKFEIVGRNRTKIGFYMGQSCVYLSFQRTTVVWDFMRGRYGVVSSPTKLAIPLAVSDHFM